MLDLPDGAISRGKRSSKGRYQHYDILKLKDHYNIGACYIHLCDETDETDAE